MLSTTPSAVPSVHVGQTGKSHVSALSVLNPSVDAATVRRTFQPQGEDRHAQQVRCPDCPDGVAQCDSAAHWWEHVSSIGDHPSSFDE